MDIGGDPEDLRHHATVLRSWADTVDDEADRLHGGGSVTWESTAGDAFRHLLDADITLVGTVSDRIRDAAARLDDLADTLTARQQWLEAARAKVESGVETAEELVSRGASSAWHGASHVLHDLGGLL